MAWLGSWACPRIILVFTYLLLLFPDGRLPSSRWKPVAWLAAVALVITVIPVAITGWPIRGPILANIGEEAPAGAPAAFKAAYDIQVFANSEGTAKPLRLGRVYGLLEAGVIAELPVLPILPDAHAEPPCCTRHRLARLLPILLVRAS